MDQNRLIDAQFDRAVEIVQGLPKTGPIQTSYDDKLEMYSLFKQATVGDVQTARPAMWDVLGRAKWDAWSKQRSLGQREAKWLYVQTLQKVLRRYSDRTVAREMVRDLDEYGAQIDPSELELQGLHPTSEDDSSSESSSDRQPREDDGAGRPGGPVDDSLVCSRMEAYQEESVPVSTPRRPESTVSSQARYRTPHELSVASLQIPPGARSMMSPSLQDQPNARYTPTAFPSRLGRVPQPLAPQSYASPVAYPVNQAPATSGTPQQARFEPQRTQRFALDSTLEAIHASLAAVHERLDTLEVGLRGSNIRSTSVGQARSQWDTSSSVRGGISGTLPFDIRQTGGWSIILIPLRRIFAQTSNLVRFIAYPPDPAVVSASKIIIRRLVLDGSFLIFLVAAIRRLQISTRARRAKIYVALLHVWLAMFSGDRAPMLLERAVGTRD